MCTLSVIRTGDGFRVVHNRDEQRTRAEGEPPAWRDVGGGRRAIFPVDPDAGGTWVAARDDGVVYAILNVNPSAPESPESPESPGSSGSVSRGRVILDLLGEAADAPLRHAESEAMRSYRVVRIRWDGGAVVVEQHRSFGEERRSRREVLERPRVWVSSGL